MGPTYQTHCRQLIVRKISKFDVTRRQILRLECTKFDFHWSSATDPARGAYSALTDTLAVLKGPTSKGKDKGKVFTYSLPSVGPGADPDVQAVSPQET